MKLVRTLSTMNNPWLGLDQLSKIRVKESIKYNAFWIMDVLGQYGLMIQCNDNFIQPKREIKLKGIQIKIDNTSTPNHLILLLKDLTDWELFLVLCNDLVHALKEYDEDIIKNIVKRLERWQKLLQRETLKIMSKEEQMGLFSELKILQDYLIPKYGYGIAIRSWVGALGDKQDFLLENLAIEVKSYRITAGHSVWISSKEQLNSEKQPLYLFGCALNEVTSGETIADLVQSISEQVETEKLLNEFIDKVEQYGYISEIQQESLSKLRLEKINGYEVEEEFPKISLNHVLPLIKNMKYSIDLSGCSQFEVDVPNILK
ncbi:TPA: PD-(D/E)XK motif protein [Bacillus cereus]|nr:PD-(D/E)XK motif protein [Bacillus cereus]HDR4638357.1 PD-(D/E)XK motif protein [Bacillus cereus]HDR4644540.1 PD-(D/E)XK motif protein [Bacillus cereus]HDR4650441.1 PD-(D/E)XK motif protein [Bacillus cereus]HDR4673237.1 PD-(D/E)XK motif protein [Bacillus cereus]